MNHWNATIHHLSHAAWLACSIKREDAESIKSALASVKELATEAA